MQSLALSPFIRYTEISEELDTLFQQSSMLALDSFTGDRMPTEYVDCVLAPGFFDNELYVIVGDSSAIVSRRDVKVTSEPHDHKNGQGKVCVYIIERKADRVLVEIPGQPVVGGLRTWIAREHSSAVA